MTTHDSQTVLLPSEHLGSVENYDPTVPLARVTAKNSVHAGCLYLRATLDELVKIRSLSASLGVDHRDLIRETRAQYDSLSRQQAELELFEKRNWFYRLFKRSIKRARRAFVNDAYELWDSTAKTSDKMKRDLLSTRSADLTSVTTDSVAKGEQVSGVAVDIDGPLTQEAIDTIREAASILASVKPFSDQTSPDSEDKRASSTDTTLVSDGLSSVRNSGSTIPSSPGSASSFSYLSLNLNYNFVSNTDSTISGLVMSNVDSGN